MSTTPETILIKIGGRAFETELIDSMMAEIADLSRTAHVVVVHGGGAEVTRVSALFGIETRFENGIRMTGQEEMHVVEMVLAGFMNKRVARKLSQSGIRAVGICGADGGCIVGTAITDSQGSASRTGRIERVETGIIEALWSKNYLPVMASTASDADGNALNINADDVAFALAAALRAELLLFVSDIPGVLKEQNVLPRLSPPDIEREVAAGVIAGGMIPKTRSAEAALSAGVNSVVIGRYDKQGDIARLIDNSIGTLIAR